MAENHYYTSTLLERQIPPIFFRRREAHVQRKSVIENIIDSCKQEIDGKGM
jgi:hypothetical protein